VTHRELRDYHASLESHRQALQIVLNLHGENNRDVANIYHEIGVTQHHMNDYKSALESHQQALRIRSELFGDDHPDTAESYYSIGVIQHLMKDYKAAIESHEHALKIYKLLKNDSDTASTYNNIGVTRHEMKNYASALDAHQHALQMRLELFGEDHPETAQSYREIELTQQATEDCKSKQKALKTDRELKLAAGENHPGILSQGTARSYDNVEDTRHATKDFDSAKASRHHADQITSKQTREDHGRGDKHEDTKQNKMKLPELQSIVSGAL
jgi:tetratricopeptide (TPR) repeat protein